MKRLILLIACCLPVVLHGARSVAAAAPHPHPHAAHAHAHAHAAPGQVRHHPPQLRHPAHAHRGHVPHRKYWARVPHYQKYAPHWRYYGYYPRYEGAFHARQLQDIGFPTGDIPSRGRPW